MRRRSLSLVGVLCLSLVQAAVIHTVSAQAPSPLRLPFAAGTSWKVIQGYNGGTHSTTAERYALDLVRDGGATAGAEVLAPAAGTVWYMNAPGSGNGCLLIKIDGGSGLIVEMCHIIARPFRTDERIAAGQPLGTIGPAGTVGNNGTAHLHLSMHRTPDLGITRISVPFAPPDGLPLDGVSLPADGSYNQYACAAACRTPLVSTNGRPAGAAAVAAPVSASLSAVPAGTVAPIPAAPVSLRAGAIARVAGDGDCINLREGPGITAPVLTCLPDGLLVTIADGPITADGHVWWRLQGMGWAAGEFLAAVAPATPALRVGASATVDAGEGDCLNLREAPALSAPTVACLPHGARLTITDGPREADGRTWWQLDGRGWAAADYLRPRE